MSDYDPEEDYSNMTEEERVSVCAQREDYNRQYEANGEDPPYPLARKIHQIHRSQQEADDYLLAQAIHRSLQEADEGKMKAKTTQTQAQPRVGDTVQCVGGDHDQKKGTVTYVYADGPCQVRLAGCDNRVKVAHVTVIENVETQASNDFRSHVEASPQVKAGPLVEAPHPSFRIWGVRPDVRNDSIVSYNGRIWYRDSKYYWTCTMAPNPQNIIRVSKYFNRSKR